MIPIDQATDYQRCIHPWVFDRIEITGSRFTQPATTQHPMTEVGRPYEPVAFSILGTFHCDYESGPHLAVLASMARDIVGAEFGGFFGMRSGRRVGP